MKEKKYDKKDVERFFFKKKVTAVLFIVFIMYFFVTSFFNNIHESGCKIFHAKSSGGTL